MHTPQFKLSPLAIAAFLAVSGAHGFASAADTAQQTETASASASADKPAVMPSVTITASADASAEGLSKVYAGGQVARGGRLGLLGTTDIMNAPYNSTSYTQQLIQDQQAKGVADVLQNDASVRVARGYGNFQELYMIRGFSVNSDDIAYNGLYGMLPRQFVASEFLERVEVLRGANSFINGASPGGGGIGGAINLVPKRAGNTPLTEVSAGVETGGQAYVAADVARRFGENNNIGIRVNAVRRAGETSVDNEQRTLSAYSVGMDYRGRDFRLSADVGYQDNKLTDPRPSVYPGSGALASAPDNTVNFGQPWSYSNERDTFGTVRGEYDIAPDVVAWAAFGGRGTAEANSLGTPTISSTDGTASAYRFDNARRDTVRSGEVGARGKLRTGDVSHELSATASGFWQDSRNSYAISNFAGFATNIYSPVSVAAPSADYFTGGDMSAPHTTAKTILSSYAVADTMGFIDDTVLLTVGAREQKIKTMGYDYNTGAQNASYDKSAVTPMAGIVYKPGKNVSVYANYSEALQAGAVASGTDANGNVVSNLGEMFAPTKSRQKEVGVKYDAGTLGMTAALFSITQPSSYVENGVYGQFGEQRNQGLELSVFGSPMRGVRLLGGLTLIDAELRTTQNGVNQGNDAIGVPDTQLNLGAEWDVPGVTGLTLTGRALYTSSQYANAANTQELPSWTRLDLGARYTTVIASHDVTFRLRVDNATDKSYWASSGGSSGSGYLVLSTPRTVGLSATVAF